MFGGGVVTVEFGEVLQFDSPASGDSIGEACPVVSCGCSATTALGRITRRVDKGSNIDRNRAVDMLGSFQALLHGALLAKHSIGVSKVNCFCLSTRDGKASGPRSFSTDSVAKLHVYFHTGGSVHVGTKTSSAHASKLAFGSLSEVGSSNSNAPSKKRKRKRSPSMWHGLNIISGGCNLRRYR